MEASATAPTAIHRFSGLDLFSICRFRDSPTIISKGNKVINDHQDKIASRSVHPFGIIHIWVYTYVNWGKGNKNCRSSDICALHTLISLEYERDSMIVIAFENLFKFVNSNIEYLILCFVYFDHMKKKNNVLNLS